MPLITCWPVRYKRVPCLCIEAGVRSWAECGVSIVCLEVMIWFADLFPCRRVSHYGVQYVTVFRLAFQHTRSRSEHSWAVPRPCSVAILLAVAAVELCCVCDGAFLSTMRLRAARTTCIVLRFAFRSYVARIEFLALEATFGIRDPFDGVESSALDECALS